MFIHRLKSLLVFLLFSVFLVSGCAATKVSYFKDLPKSTPKYDVIELPDFVKDTENWVPYDSGSIIPNMVAEELRENRSYGEVLRATDAASGAEGSLLVRGQVLNYDAGCKFCEWYIGFNDHGKSSIVVRVEFIDASSGDVLADVEILGKSKKPGTGESRYVRIVDKIVAILDDINHRG